MPANVRDREMRHPDLVRSPRPTRAPRRRGANAIRKKVSSNPKCAPPEPPSCPVKYHHSLLNSSWLPWSAGKEKSRRVVARANPVPSPSPRKRIPVAASAAPLGARFAADVRWRPSAGREHRESRRQQDRAHDIIPRSAHRRARLALRARPDRFRPAAPPTRQARRPRKGRRRNHEIHAPPERAPIDHVYQQNSQHGPDRHGSKAGRRAEEAGLREHVVVSSRGEKPSDRKIASSWARSSSIDSSALKTPRNATSAARILNTSVI